MIHGAKVNHVLATWHQQLDQDVAELLAVAERKDCALQVVLYRRPGGKASSAKVTFSLGGIDTNP